MQFSSCFLFKASAAQMCPLLSMYVRMEWENLGTSRDPYSFVEKCVRFLRITNQQVDPIMAALPSPTAGARDEWLSVHEAGHAIVGVKAGFALRGKVRFYGDHGFPGEARFEDVEWRSSRDEDLLRRLIRVDVAGNIAEMLHPTCKAPQGRLSDLYRDRTSGDRPTDFISADARAKHLATVLLEGAGKAFDSDDVWRARQALIQQAEIEATQVLQCSLETLDRLALQLKCGLKTGTAVRLIMEDREVSRSGPT